MVRFQIFLSKIFIGSILLTSTAHAYPIEYFPAALKLYQQPMPITEIRSSVNSPRESVRFGNKLRTEGVNIRIEPVQSERQFVTRAEFLKATIEGIYPDGLPVNCTEQLSSSNYWLYFRDVPTSADYGPHLCIAMIMGMVSGYSDVTFKPHRPINFAEASKILTKVHGIAVDSSDQNVEWYTPYVETMNSQHALPRNIELDDYVSPSTMAYMVNALNR
ncbi:S-layer homology domain-containing protein [Patescibacteria group bacterium]|nr:S-layer homology domain-containing protein [Patescibacteria group bacterium]